MISPKDIFDISIPFEEKALHIFDFQQTKNPVYRKFCEALEIHDIRSTEEIPLLPIQAFKDAKVITAADNSTFNIQHLKFHSSGTSGMKQSTHYIPDPEIYRQSIIRGMRHFYELDEFVIWAYTPGYSDNPNSSLIWMLNTLIEGEESGLSKFLELGKPLDKEQIREIQKSGKRLMLFGAAFGFLDLLEWKKVRLPGDSMVVETGGMKTHRREITKKELHQKLADEFGLLSSQIHSEYGMAELLSQAYSKGDKWFECVPWMSVSIQNPKNPMEKMPNEEEGLIGVIDLANLHSCSFILTGDKGIKRPDGKFQVLGRWSPQNLRGCNFLIDND